MKRFLILAALGLAASPALAQDNPGGPFTVQETGKSYDRLTDAVDSMNGADVTVIIAPGTYHQCKVSERGRVAMRAKVSGTVIFDGTICEGKAALVFRGTDALVDGIVFQNLSIPDGNAAGIRLEHGNLTVMNSVFRNSQEGILGGEDRAATIRVDRSSFSGLGRCDGGTGCAHSIYMGYFAKLYVTRSRFEKGRGGHYVKSRTAFVSITDNSFDDSQGHATNYMVDLPSGSTGLIARNIMLDGPDKENHSGFIVIRAEETINSSAGLTITGNTATMAPGASYRPTFVIDFSHEPLKISGNTLGAGITPFETR